MSKNNVMIKNDYLCRETGKGKKRDRKENEWKNFELNRGNESASFAFHEK